MTAGHHIGCTLVVPVIISEPSCIAALSVRTSAPTASSPASSSASLPALTRGRSDEGKVNLNRLI